MFLVFMVIFFQMLSVPGVTSEINQAESEPESVCLSLFFFCTFAILLLLFNLQGNCPRLATLWHPTSNIAA